MEKLNNCKKTYLNEPWEMLHIDKHIIIKYNGVTVARASYSFHNWVEIRKRIGRDVFSHLI